MCYHNISKGLAKDIENLQIRHLSFASRIEIFIHIYQITFITSSDTICSREIFRILYKKLIWFEIEFKEFY